MTRFTIMALTLVVIGSLFSPPAKALILTGPPAIGVCQTMADFPSIVCKMDEEEIQVLADYKWGCWEYLVENAPPNLLRPGPRQFLNRSQRRVIHALEERFKKQWNATHPTKKLN